MKKVLRAPNPAIHPQRPRRHLGSVTSVTAAVLTALYGAPAAAAPAPVSNDDSALQEVVVTASRRAVSAQDLPISITAVSGEMLAQAGVQDMAGLAHSIDRKSTRLNSSHVSLSRMPSSA